MPVHAWTVLCSKVIIDEESKLVSLIESTEKVTVSATSTELELASRRIEEGGSPVIPIELSLASWFVRSNYSVPARGADAPETAQARYRLLLPDGKRAVDQEIPIEIPARSAGRRIKLKLAALPFLKHDAVLWFTVELQRGRRWEMQTRIPLEYLVTQEDGPVTDV